ncbi:hypothetical protein M419DRAFT_11406 [Trichoderma reesei RUT C-30]|uniref:Uncharacterized protein n=1 Tax=Hypocrea jecorina (strain ATCC 56765 / BCRC 32924 / NRRL 11460 / Rut C-30) TaxID=1344414 RepID=A0A024S0V4_HYPJR|nr:hypothetical protein M419DRAFT_11406 [Trichoderma reesei RUT C-30]
MGASFDPLCRNVRRSFVVAECCGSGSVGYKTSLREASFLRQPTRLPLPL